MIVILILLIPVFIVLGIVLLFWIFGILFWCCMAVYILFLMAFGFTAKALELRKKNKLDLKLIKGKENNEPQR